MNSFEIIEKFNQDREHQIKIVKANIQTINEKLEVIKERHIDVIEEPEKIVQREREKRQLQRDLEDEQYVLDALLKSKAPVTMEQLEIDLKELLSPYNEEIKVAAYEAKELRDQYLNKIKELHNVKDKAMREQGILCKYIEYVDDEFTPREFRDYAYALPNKDIDPNVYGILKPTW